MKNLQMPYSYISVSEEELRSISGGGPLGDAFDLSFSNLRLDDLFFSGGLISLSFTFVPMLLFNVVKTGFNFVVSAYDTIADLFHFSHEEREMVQYISDQQQPLQRRQSQERSRCKVSALVTPLSEEYPLLIFVNPGKQSISAASTSSASFFESPYRCIT